MATGLEPLAKRNRSWLVSGTMASGASPVSGSRDFCHSGAPPSAGNVPGVFESMAGQRREANAAVKSKSPGKSAERVRRGNAAGVRRRTLRLLVEAQYVVRAALSSLLDESSSPEVSPCIHELAYAARWFCDALERHLPRRREGDWEDAVARLGVSIERMAEVPTLADRLRLINRAQRWTVAQIAVLLAEDLDPDVRALLEEASAIYLRGGRRCEEIIAALDRDRELPPAAG